MRLGTNARLRQRAWLVHLYTGAGAVTAILALDAIARANYRTAFLIMATALVIDATDGPFARAFQVRRHLPEFDGALLDNIVDYLNYVLVPVWLMLQADLLPAGRVGLGIAGGVLYASAYGFCRVDAKTADFYFRGFPSYWNLVAFYLYCLNWPRAVNTTLVVVLAIAVFLPLKFIYPNRTIPFRALSLVLAGLWGIATLILVIKLPEPHPLLLYGSLTFIAYYFGMSLVLQLTTSGPGARPAP